MGGGAGCARRAHQPGEQRVNPKLTALGAQQKQWKGPEQPARPQLQPAVEASLEGHLVAQEMVMV